VQPQFMGEMTAYYTCRRCGVLVWYEPDSIALPEDLLCEDCWLDLFGE